MQPNASIAYRENLRPAEAALFLGISVPSLWRWAKERPDFPKPRKISPRVSIWSARSLQEWIDKQSEA